MRLGVYKRIGNAIRSGGSQLMRKVSIELERDKKMCSETLSSIWSGNAPLQEQSVETLCILFDYLSRHVDMDGKLRGFFSAAEIDSARLVECEIPQRSSKIKMHNADTKLRYMATIYDKMYKSICCGVFGKVCKFEDAAWAAARNVVWSAENDAALDIAYATSRAARDAAREHEVEMLRELLEEGATNDARRSNKEEHYAE